MLLVLLPHPPQRRVDKVSGLYQRASAEVALGGGSAGRAHVFEAAQVAPQLGFEPADRLVPSNGRALGQPLRVHHAHDQRVLHNVCVPRGA